MKMRIILIFMLLVSISFGEKVVKYAAVIYRHGDRTPIDLYPTDPWKNESLWPVKFGELTNTGKQQHYALGKWLRKRYTNLISEQFDPKEIYVRSTDVDRTLMSAQANLAGMYPPTGSAIWDPYLLWQPIPVHTKPQKDDEVLAMKKKCPAYSNEKARYMHSAAYKKRLSKYTELMDYLTAYTGVKVKDYLDIINIYSILYIESLYNFTLPNWTQSVYPEKLREPACYSFVTATGTPLMSRLLTGPLIKEIVGKMDAVIANKKPDPLKLSIYSGHDLTIGNVLCSMGVYDGNCPDYTATVIFELFQDNSTMDYFIQMSYRNSPKIVEPLIINIPHCGQMCPYKRFIKLYDNLVTVDWDHECEVSSRIALAIVVALCLNIYMLARIYYAKKTRREKIFIPVNNKPTAAMDENC